LDRGVALRYTGFVPGFLMRLLLNALALWMVSAVIPGIRVDGALPLLGAALVLGLLNAFVRPLLVILTLPIMLVTLGLFLFVINGLLLWLTASLVGGFHVTGFWSAVFGALLLSFFSFLLGLFVNDRGRIEYVYVERRIV
jgi:putative membrane protein